MIIKVTDAPGLPGGKALTLYQDDGTVVPWQLSSRLSQETGEPTEFTVTLIVDGTDIRLSE